MIDVSLAPPSAVPASDALLVAVRSTTSGPVVVASGLDDRAVESLGGLARTLGMKGDRDEVRRGPGDAGVLSGSGRLCGERRCGRHGGLR